ncbi:PAS domain S-box protein [Halobaculum sp. CBA1158]|uniref:sensor histidine kinase n=1 Tax=Halobaculum sp. CBA1158 TaxID=2904243 RepID=UPI001F2713BA|nr:PAS domain-containing sensor histidine kinase [Halobaculum sp. CBA1158]UIO99661.1 PAS domain S-box protein [Halobaculum sp. CBA1158]
MSTNDPVVYREAFRETVDPAVITDTDLVITDVNDAAREFTGYDREELIGSTPATFVSDEAVYADIEETVREGERWADEFEFTTRDGGLVYGHGCASPLVIDGDTRGYALVFSDMTRRRRYEESLRILNRVLRHNLRNDANVVLGHVERVADEVAERVDGPGVASLLDSLDTAADRVDDMLERARTTRRFSGVLAGDTGTLRPIDLAAALEEAVADAPTADVSVTDEVSGPLPVLADEMLPSALYAVVENAIEHNDAAHPRLHLSAREEDDRVVLSIADNGPGIDPSRHDEIFGYGEHTQVEHGEGLSLFFVDRLMEVYGGEVDIRANDPDGTVFTLGFRRGDESALSREGSDGSRTDPDASHDDPDAPAHTAESIADGSGPASTPADVDPSTGILPPTDGVGSRPARPPSDRPEQATAADRSLPDASPDPDPGTDPAPSLDSPPTGLPDANSVDPSDSHAAEADSTDRENTSASADRRDSTRETTETVAAAVGDSVTADRLAGDARGFPPVSDALSEHEQPHHLLRLRAGDPVGGSCGSSLRGAAAVAFTDTAAVVVVDGDDGGRLVVPYRSLTAVARERDAVVLDAGGTTYRLLLPRAADDGAAVDDAVTFLERELR